MLAIYRCQSPFLSFRFSSHCNAICSVSLSLLFFFYIFPVCTIYWVSLNTVWCFFFHASVLNVIWHTLYMIGLRVKRWRQIAETVAVASTSMGSRHTHTKKQQSDFGLSFVYFWFLVVSIELYQMLS